MKIPSQNQGASATEPSQITGANAAAKDVGHGYFPALLQSCGIHDSSHDDVQEGRAILRGMGYGVSSDLPEVKGKLQTRNRARGIQLHRTGYGSY